MPIPAEIEMCEVTFGNFFKDFDGSKATGTVTFHSPRLVWEATGETILAQSIPVQLVNGTGTIELPYTDQTGFVDGNGNDLSDWTYRASFALNQDTIPDKTFNLPTGPASVDLDLLIPVAHSGGVTASTPIVTSVNGETGAVTIDDIASHDIDDITGLEAALDLKADLAGPTFTGSVTVPTPTTTGHATTKGYVDSAVAGATIADATDIVKGKVQLAGDLSGTAAAPTVVGLHGEAVPALDDGVLTSTSGVLSWEPVTGSGDIEDYADVEALDGYPAVIAAGATAADARTAIGAAATADLTGKVDATGGTAANLTMTGSVTVPDAALAIAKVSGLQTALDGKAAAASPTITGTADFVNIDVSGTTAFAAGSIAQAAVSGLTTAIAAATATSTGTVELATDAEATTGTDTTRAVTPANVAAVVATITPASIGAEPEITGDPVEGAILAHDGADPIWVVPALVTSAEIPHATTTVEAVLLDLLARMNAVETTGPRLTNGTLPTITGTTEVGETVTAGNGTWSQTPDSYTYQWKRSGVDIGGATSSTYVLVTGDIGTSTVSVEVTATKAGFTDGVAESNPVSVTVASEASVATFVTAYADSATSLVVSRPSGLANGDWLVAILRSTLSIGSTDWICDDGGTWNRIGPAWPGASGAARVVGFYTRKVTDAGSEPASYEFEHNGAAGRRVGVLLVLRGLDGTTPVDVAVTDYYGTSITNGRRTASLTVTQNNCLQIFAGTSDFSTMTEVPTTTPTGFTLITTAKTSATAPSSRTYLWIGSREVDTGATGTSDIAWSAGAVDPVAQSIVFAPA